MKKYLLFLSLLCLPVIATPVDLSNWNVPHKEYQIDKGDYKSVLNCNAHIPYFSYYTLKPENFATSVDRRDYWPNYITPEVKSVCGSNFAIISDYDVLSKWYDVGHLAPAADFSTTREHMNGTCVPSNAAPQINSFNRGVWARLERYERNLAVKENGITVITGVIPGVTKSITDVNIPSHYFKIIMYGKKMEVYIGANEKGSKIQEITLEELEKLLGYSLNLK